MSVRVYLPVGADQLATLVAQRRLPGPCRAHAVTDVLRADWPEGDEEAWEYAALMAAAADSGPGRRRVVAADVGAVVECASADEPTRVEVPHDVVWKQVAAAHVDTEDGAGDDDDLAWFATQEIPGLV